MVLIPTLKLKEKKKKMASKEKQIGIVGGEAIDELEEVRHEYLRQLENPRKGFDMWDAFTVLDRVSVINQNIEDYLMSQACVVQNPELFKLVYEATQQLAEAYQLVANVFEEAQEENSSD